MESIIERSEGAQIGIEKVDEGKKDGQRKGKKHHNVYERGQWKDWLRPERERERDMGESLRKKRRIGI